MKLASLVSGGKDSLYATYLSMRQGHEIKYLVTMIPRKIDSWMFHHPCIELTKLQAEAMGIKQIIQKTSGEQDKELNDLKKVLKKIKSEVDSVVSGAIASTYQKSRIDKICEELNLKSITPLWHENPEKLIEKESSAFEILITAVAADGFDKTWLGRKIDKICIEDLKKINKKYGIHITGEGGEFETFVLDAPIFKKKIEFINWKKVWDNKTNSGYLEVGKAKLVSK